jgi:hypothetical protein
VCLERRPKHLEVGEEEELVGEGWKKSFGVPERCELCLLERVSCVIRTPGARLSSDALGDWPW